MGIMVLSIKSMDTSKLKNFARFARQELIKNVSEKLKTVLTQESPARREKPEAVQKLEEKIKADGEEQVIEQIAYIWFNRFCALRYMDVNNYNSIRVVSPAEGQSQPEILAEAKQGQFDEKIISEATQQHSLALLNGEIPSKTPEEEVYRLLVVSVCNDLHHSMPFLFERIDDYTELLMPDDLLWENSILSHPYCDDSRSL